jgi:hypothetical protein
LDLLPEFVRLNFIKIKKSHKLVGHNACKFSTVTYVVKKFKFHILLSSFKVADNVLRAYAGGITFIGLATRNKFNKRHELSNTRSRPLA